MFDMQMSEERKTKTHQIAADINNIVIVLLRYNFFFSVSVACGQWMLYVHIPGWSRCKRDFLR